MMDSPITHATLPVWVFHTTDDPPKDAVLWYGDDAPPGVGEEINITGTEDWRGCHGTVEGYRVDPWEPHAGILMVCVRVANRPDWHIEQDPERHVAVFAGTEIERNHR